MKTENSSKRFKLAMMLIAIGIVYGDIGTSPLYVMKAIVETNGGIEDFGTNNVFKVQLILGFRIHQNVNLYIKQIAHSMLQKGCIPEQKRTYGTNPSMKVADFSCIILQDELPIDAKIAWRDRLIVEAKIFLKRFTASPIRWFELPSNEVHYEVVPISMSTYKSPPIKQVKRTKK
ncbi:hypothetical protein ERX37_03890 [Macrococcus hajekii]|uniref:Potassium transporter Kup n=1 Tax=Macrococcus hajekii TaxID=198482 RepID=A0A4R6BN25_9STAP|nr:KUP/HAK/KT family potassium transporter [Macrococcus hajekii]TDM03236.1 hypothetical protein ERX37_03890 [Macrococcus hajekii]GGA97191.1 hypothetical protein GCM10007190_01450 [Macrococcus hajekii]